MPRPRARRSRRESGGRRRHARRRRRTSAPPPRAPARAREERPAAPLQPPRLQAPRPGAPRLGAPPRSRSPAMPGPRPTPACPRAKATRRRSPAPPRSRTARRSLPGAPASARLRVPAARPRSRRDRIPRSRPSATTRRARFRSTRRCPGSLVSFRSGVGLETDALVVKLLPEEVAELVALGVEIAPVLVVREHLDRHLLDDRQAVRLDPLHLARIVREEPDGGQAEVGEDLVPEAVLARVRREAELDVRLDRVEALLLQLVGAELVQEPDAPALLGHVQKHAVVLPADLSERLLELLAAVAAERVEDVAGQAFRVGAHEHALLAGGVAAHERDVLLAAQDLPICDRLELAVLRRHPHRDHALDELLGAPPVLDQVGDGDHLDLVPVAELGEIRHPGHRPVLVHDLADDARGDEPGELREIDRRLRLAAAVKHATGPGAEREDMAGLDEIV